MPKLPWQSHWLTRAYFVLAFCLASLVHATGAPTLTYDRRSRLTKDAGTSGIFNGITVSNRFSQLFGRDQLRLEISGQSAIQHDFGYDTSGGLSTVGYGVYSAAYEDPATLSRLRARASAPDSHPLLRRAHCITYQTLCESHSAPQPSARRAPGFPTAQLKKSGAGESRVRPSWVFRSSLSACRRRG